MSIEKSPRYQMVKTLVVKKNISNLRNFKKYTKHFTCKEKGFWTKKKGEIKHLYIHVKLHVYIN